MTMRNRENKTNPPSRTERLLSEKECAEYLGVSLATLRRARRDGPRKNHLPAPPAIKLGRLYKYSVATLETFIRKHEQENNDTHANRPTPTTALQSTRQSEPTQKE